MGAIKSGIYTEQQEIMAEIARALGHPARIRILEELAEQKSCRCGQLAEIVGLSQPTMSQHLKELKQVGLIKGSIDSNRSCYCLSNDKLKDFINFLEQLKNTGRQMECC